MSKLPIINFFAFLLMAITNFLAANRIVWKYTPSDVSHLYENMFTPADYTFSIWGFIYTCIGIFIIKDFLNKDKSIAKETRIMGYLFALTCCFNIAWLTAWATAAIQVSFLFIFMLWAILAWIYYQLAIHQASPIYTIPISLYLAWIAVSIIGHFNVLLIYIDYPFAGLTEESWTIILVSITTIGGLLMHYWNQDVLFNLALIWALIGIYSKHYQNYTFDNNMIQAIVLGATILVVVTLVIGFKKLVFSRSAL